LILTKLYTSFLIHFLAASGILSLLFVASALGGVIEDFEYLSVDDMCELLPQDTSFLHPNTCDSWVRCATNYSVLE